MTKRKTNKLKYQYKIKFNYANFTPVLFTDLQTAKSDMKKGLKHLYKLGLLNIRCTLYKRQNKGISKWRKLGKYSYNPRTNSVLKRK